MQEVNAPSVRWEWISEAWNLFSRQWSVWVLMILVTGLVMGLIYAPFYVVTLFTLMPSVSEDGVVTPASGILPILIIPVMYLVIACAASWLSSGLYSSAFKQVRGEQIGVGDLFSGGRYFPRMIGAMFLVGIATLIGSIFCLIPGLIISGLAFLTAPMIVEGGKGPIDAIKASVEVTKKDWIMFTIFALALGFIAGAGSFACGIGVLATAPLLFLGHALAYRDLVGVSGAQPQVQLAQPQQPDYGYYTPSQAPPAPPDYRSYTPTPTPTPTPAPTPAPTPSQTPPAPPQPPSWEAQTVVTPAVSEAPAMTCPHCGAALARVVNFCNQCGRPLRRA